MTNEVKVLNDDALREIEARTNAATDGPWGVLPSNNGTLAHVETQEGTTAEQGQGFTVCSIPKKRINDAEFIAHAREDISALCGTVRVLRQQVAEEEQYSNKLALKVTICEGDPLAGDPTKWGHESTITALR